MIDLESKRLVKLGISPCPNDTFIFESLINAEVNDFPFALDVEFHDVQTLNEKAKDGGFDIIKVSCGALVDLVSEYEVLHSGGAMGFGCGPLLLSSQNYEFNPELPTYLPGKDTTAALLFEYWSRENGFFDLEKIYLPFDELYNGLLSGKVEQGVVIHESRFTYEQDGLLQIDDLGSFWENVTGYPIPLGVILCRRSLGQSFVDIAERAISKSVDNAWEKPELITPFIREHAQIENDLTIEEHIRMFVNEFSRDMGEEGKQAINILLDVAKQLK